MLIITFILKIEKKIKELLIIIFMLKFYLV